MVWWRHVVVWIALISLAGPLFLGGGAAGAQASVDVEAESAILVDAETGTILFEKNADQALPPASMSKMMTEYLVLEAMQEGKFTWGTVVTASEYAHYLGSLDGTSRIWLALGEERTVEELYTAMAVYSANDATVALAELVAGSEAQFVQMMNAKAKELGMTNSSFVNATGLPNRMLGEYMHTGTPEEENAMSARDTAILARSLVRDYPEVLRFSSIPVVEPGEGQGQFPVRMLNFNWMLADHPQIDAKPYAYEGLDGLKTGYTEQAGYCFTGTAQRGDMRLISVVMRTDSEGARFRETKKLLDHGFNHFKVHRLVAEGETIEGYETLPVAKGKEEEVPVQVGSNLELLLADGEEEKIQLDVELNQELTTEEGLLTAPIEEGEVVGYLRVTGPEESFYGFLAGEDQLVVPLIAAEAVEEAGLMRQTLRGVGSIFSGIWSSLVDGIKSLVS